MPFLGPLNGLLRLGTLVLLAGMFLASIADAALGDKYLLGAGKADITGPVVELPFHGYAMLEQKGTGLRQRIFSRAFIIGSTGSSASRDRFLYIIVDTMGGDSAIRRGIIEGVQKLGPAYAVYTDANIAVIGTHSHSGPGGWHNYLLHQFPSLGFNQQSYDAIVAGGVLSVKRAHEALAEGYLDVGTAEVPGTNINRSPFAYLANPAEERAKYPGDTDTTMTLLRFTRASDLKVSAVMTWYAVHGTSLYNNNTLVTGDNKGVAAIMLENDMSAAGNTAPGFVAGFSQANVGDVSPNVGGAWCEDGSKAQCGNTERSTCADGSVVNCHGRGPKYTEDKTGTASCYEIGRRQFAAAKSILSGTGWTPIAGPTVKSFHFYNDMRYFNFPGPDGTSVTTCPAALGYSFGAGTTDGPGLLGFYQGDRSGAKDPSDWFQGSANPFWNVVSGVIRIPSPEQKACHGAKPILLDVGEMEIPYAWAPNIMDISVLRVGQLLMVISPAEATTMAGRRWRAAVAEAARPILPVGVDPIVVIGGPANSYSHYAVTPEEYDVQRYEGASTLFGKWTLNAYIYLTSSNIIHLTPGATSSPPTGPSPPDNRNAAKGFSFLPDPPIDTPPIFRNFGDVLTAPSAKYQRGATVSAVFVGANPRNNLRLEGTFATVERFNDNRWSKFRDDTDWHLTYEWKRPFLSLTGSEVTISWDTNESGSPAPAGRYRIKYSGDAKLGLILKPILSFEGVTAEFTLS